MIMIITIVTGAMWFKKSPVSITCDWEIIRNITS